ncbi:MAG: NapH/MauN family ferredoxin-type protein [Burkholderiales bacterium]|jgi:ferredoxin-type protein NapH|nr:NapH/MauN family ferredoxin-type protein [Burkholderiales bacterium]
MSKQQRVLAQTETYRQTLIRRTEHGWRMTFRVWRVLTALGCMLLFALSYWIDIQILEGTLTGSRFIGLHLIDPFATLQVFFAYHAIPVNMAIGTITILFGYFILGGRSFCGWVCPYGALSEVGENIRLRLIEKKIIKKGKRLSIKAKYFIWATFLLVSLLTGILMFEMFNVVGIIYRALLYGGSLSLLIVLFILFIEIFISRRVWCRSVCPVGATYGLLNPITLLKIKTDKSRCNKCGACTVVCHVPEALAPLFSSDEKEKYITSTDCTLCGRCVDVCSENGLAFFNRIRNLA